MKVNNSVPFKNWKIVLFSIIIALLELAAMKCNIVMLITPRFYLGRNLLIILVILTTLIYYNLIYKHYQNEYSSLIRFKSTIIQWVILYAILIIYIKFIYNPPIQPEGGGAGSIEFLIDFFFVFVLPIAINLFSFIIEKIINVFIANKK